MAKLLPTDHHAASQRCTVVCRRCGHWGCLVLTEGDFECRERDRCDLRKRSREKQGGLEFFLSGRAWERLERVPAENEFL